MGNTNLPGSGVIEWNQFINFGAIISFASQFCFSFRLVIQVFFVFNFIGNLSCTGSFLAFHTNTLQFWNLPDVCIGFPPRCREEVPFNIFSFIYCSRISFKNGMEGPLTSCPLVWPAIAWHPLCRLRGPTPLAGRRATDMCLLSPGAYPLSCSAPTPPAPHPSVAPIVPLTALPCAPPPPQHWSRVTLVTCRLLCRWVMHRGGCAGASPPDHRAVWGTNLSYGALPPPCLLARGRLGGHRLSGWCKMPVAAPLTGLGFGLA